MSSSNYDNQQPLRELQWLANYFKTHAREDLSIDLFEQLRELRQRAQESLGTTEASDVMEFRKSTSDSENSL
ncbi:hypothetical protein BH11CYA1_BH11CYA1_41320 [soil metagenome]